MDLSVIARIQNYFRAVAREHVCGKLIAEFRRTAVKDSVNCIIVISIAVIHIIKDIEFVFQLHIILFICLIKYSDCFTDRIFQIKTSDCACRKDYPAGIRIFICSLKDDYFRNIFSFPVIFRKQFFITCFPCEHKPFIFNIKKIRLRQIYSVDATIVKR